MRIGHSGPLGKVSFGYLSRPSSEGKRVSVPSFLLSLLSLLFSLGDRSLDGPRRNPTVLPTGPLSLRSTLRRSRVLNNNSSALRLARQLFLLPRGLRRCLAASSIVLVHKLSVLTH